MRITDNMRYSGVTSTLGRITAQHQAATQEAYTGKRLTAPSDDPIASSELNRTNASQAQNATYQRVIQFVQGDAALTEGALAESGNLLQRAREITIQGGSDTLSADDRGALAQEVDDLFQQLVDLANTKGARGYLFGGSRTAGPPFQTDGTFIGDDEDHIVSLGPGQRTVVSVSGAQSFTSAGGINLFQTLQELSTSLRNNDGTAVRDQLPAIDQGIEQVLHQRGRAGVLMGRLETSANLLEQQEVSLATREETVAAAPNYESFTKLNELSQTLERAMTVSRSLLDLGNQSLG